MTTATNRSAFQRYVLQLGAAASGLVLGGSPGAPTT